MIYLVKSTHSKYIIYNVAISFLLLKKPRIMEQVNSRFKRPLVTHFHQDHKHNEGTTTTKTTWNSLLVVAETPLRTTRSSYCPRRSWSRDKLQKGEFSSTTWISRDGQYKNKFWWLPSPSKLTVNILEHTKNKRIMMAAGLIVAWWNVLTKYWSVSSVRLSASSVCTRKYNED